MTIDARGAQSPLYVLEGADAVRSAQITAAGVARDLTNATLAIVVKDADAVSGYGENTVNSETSYSQTVTDAANGEFTFKVPKEAFSNKEGQELTWQLILTESGNETALGYGTIYVQEAL